MPHRRATDRRHLATLDLTEPERLVQATLAHHQVTFRYQGLLRTVEPHLVGIHEAGEPVLVAYQSEGPSRSGDLPGWRTFILTEVEDVAVSDGQFPARPGFNPGSHPMLLILARA